MVFGEGVGGLDSGFAEDEFGLMVLSQQMICVLAQCHVMRE